VLWSICCMIPSPCCNIWSTKLSTISFRIMEYWKGHKLKCWVPSFRGIRWSKASLLDSWEVGNAENWRDQRNYSAVLQFCVANSISEQRLFGYWMKAFRGSETKCYGNWIQGENFESSSC
jgi:hypothetical protein